MGDLSAEVQVERRAKVGDGVPIEEWANEFIYVVYLIPC